MKISNAPVGDTAGSFLPCLCRQCRLYHLASASIHIVVDACVCTLKNVPSPLFLFLQRHSDSSLVGISYDALRSLGLISIELLDSELRAWATPRKFVVAHTNPLIFRFFPGNVDDGPKTILFRSYDAGNNIWGVCSKNHSSRFSNVSCVGQYQLMTAPNAHHPLPSRSRKGGDPPNGSLQSLTFWRIRSTSLSIF